MATWSPLRARRVSSPTRYASPITVALNENEIVVSRPNDERLSRSLHGLTRTLIQNLIIGVTSGYEKKLEIVGTGYRVTPKGNDLEFALGYSHPDQHHRSRGYYLRSGGC